MSKVSRPAYCSRVRGLTPNGSYLFTRATEALFTRRGGVECMRTPQTARTGPIARRGSPPRVHQGSGWRRTPPPPPSPPGSGGRTRRRGRRCSGAARRAGGSPRSGPARPSQSPFRAARGCRRRRGQSRAVPRRAQGRRAEGRSSRGRPAGSLRRRTTPGSTCAAPRRRGCSTGWSCRRGCRPPPAVPAGCPAGRAAGRLRGRGRLRTGRRHTHSSPSAAAPAKGETDRPQVGASNPNKAGRCCRRRRFPGRRGGGSAQTPACRSGASSGSTPLRACSNSAQGSASPRGGWMASSTLRGSARDENNGTCPGRPRCASCEATPRGSDPPQLLSAHAQTSE
mmetsp:Transcript_15138/g.43417  ORF Transcript_15138/g.43417 Transcript_15138/m.43417 type:complete len:339 (-) Transcript_15138:209-1225(-)